MKYQIDHDLHIHSQLSSCSKDPAQSTARILQYAVNNGRKRICLTDHFWDEAAGKPVDWYAPQNYAHISSALPLPQQEGISFYFGCEADMDANLTLGITGKMAERFDFIIIPTTHMHFMAGLNSDNWESCEKRAELYVKRLEKLLSMDLPWKKIGIAHLACGLLAHDGATHKVLSLIRDEIFVKLFTQAAELGAGIEINASDWNFAKQVQERIDNTIHVFRMAKDCGCKFYLGSDAHHPGDFEKTQTVFENAVNVLDLQETDKFFPNNG